MLKHFLIAAICLIVIAVIGSILQIQVIEVKNTQLYIFVRDGDIISHEFIHSIYDVPVMEKLRICKGSMVLFFLDSPDDAALEYYWIDRRGEGNVCRRIDEFYIPVKSIGRHSVSINNEPIFVKGSSALSGGVNIRLIQIPIIAFIFKKIEGFC
jgi:hypothetical protein